MTAQGGIHRFQEQLEAGEQVGRPPSTRSGGLLLQHPASEVNRGHTHGVPRRARGGGEQDPGVVTCLAERRGTVPGTGEVIRQDGDTLRQVVAECHAPPLRQPLFSVTRSIVVEVK